MCAFLSLGFGLWVGCDNVFIWVTSLVGYGDNVDLEGRGGGCVMIFKSWIGVVEATFTFALGLFGECNIIVFNKVE